MTLEPLIDKVMPILIGTSRPDAQAFKMLQEVRYDVDKMNRPTKDWTMCRWR